MNIVVDAGGGLRNAFGGGAIEALLDAGVAVDGWAGTSSGAINAGFMSLAPVDLGLQRAQLARLKALWLGLREPLTDPWWKVLWRLLTLKPSLHSGEPLRALLEAQVIGQPTAPLKLGCVDLLDSHFMASGLGETAGTFVDWIAASCAVPVLFPPVHDLVDGGVRSVAPLRTAFDLIRAIAPAGSPRAAEPVTIYLLLTLPVAADGTPSDPGPLPAGSFRRVWSVALRCVDILQTDDYQKDLAGARQINDMVRVFEAIEGEATVTGATWVAEPLTALLQRPAWLANKRYARIVTIAPTGIPYGMLELAPAKLAAFWQEGHAMGKAALT